MWLYNLNMPKGLSLKKEKIVHAVVDLMNKKIGHPVKSEFQINVSFFFSINMFQILQGTYLNAKKNYSLFI